MSVLKFLCVFITIFVFAVFIFVSPILANSDQETAFLAMTNAEEAVMSTYEAVLEAEQVGGNVTGLLAQLNEAGEFLANARMSYRNEDFDNTVYFANLSKNIGEKVKSQAQELRISAWNANIQRTLFTGIGSFSGMIFVTLGSFLVWRFLKRRNQ